MLDSLKKYFGLDDEEDENASGLTYSKEDELTPKPSDVTSNIRKKLLQDLKAGRRTPEGLTKGADVDTKLINKRLAEQQLENSRELDTDRYIDKDKLEEEALKQYLYKRARELR